MEIIVTTQQNASHQPCGSWATLRSVVALESRHALKRTVQCPDLHCVVEDVGDVVLLHSLSPLLEPLDQVRDRSS